MPSPTAAIAAMACLSAPALAQWETPPSRIPPDLARIISTGDARIVVVGDSISTTTSGGTNGVGHTPLVTGMHRTWQPRRWRGMWVPTPAGMPGSYEVNRGIAAAVYDQPDAFETLIPMTHSQVTPAVPPGFATDGLVQWSFAAGVETSVWPLRAQFSLWATGSPLLNPASAALLASPTLKGRHIVLTNPGQPMLPSVRYTMTSTLGASETTAFLPVDNSRLGFAGIDFDIGAVIGGAIEPWVSRLHVRPEFSRPAGAPTQHLVSQGMLFYDPAGPGLQIHSIAVGGWTNDDHLRATPPGRGYSDLGLRENLRIMGLADPGVTPIVMIATGANIGGGEAADNVATDQFSQNIRAIMDRYRSALSAIGAPEPWFMLVGMYTFGLPPPDTYSLSRVHRMWEIAQGEPRCAFFSLPELVGVRGAGFPSGWYYRQPTAATLEPYAGASRLRLTSHPAFISPGRFYITDGINTGIGFYQGIGQNELTGVTGLTGSFGPNATVMSDTYPDLHLSLVGADGIAAAMWSQIAQAARACNPDFNGDGDVGTDADIEAFFRCLAGECCPTCSPADFNNDGDTGTDADIEAFFRVLAGGSC